MEDNSLDSVFHIASRLIIIFPIIIVIIALILKFNQSPSIKSTPQLTPTPVLPPKAGFAGQAKQNNAPISLAGPLVCNFSSSTATISGYIKDKKIFASILEKNKTNYFLVRDDCLYIWEKNIYSGSKKCGISQYFALLGNLPIDQLANLPNLPIQGADIKSLINSCKKEQIKDENIFKMPINILFK